MSTHCRPVRKSTEPLCTASRPGKSEDLPRDKVFHLKGFGQGLKNADEGLSPIAAGVHSLVLQWPRVMKLRVRFQWCPTGFFPSTRS